MTRHVEWREVALTFPCTTCNAAPGEPCNTVTGEAKYEVHAARSAAAAKHQWHDADEPEGASEA